MKVCVVYQLHTSGVRTEAPVLCSNVFPLPPLLQHIHTTQQALKILLFYLARGTFDTHKKFGDSEIPAFLLYHISLSQACYNLKGNHAAFIHSY